MCRLYHISEFISKYERKAALPVDDMAKCTWLITSVTKKRRKENPLSYISCTTVT
jgi:hypothetical protein